MRKSLIGLVLVLSLSSLPAFSANTPKAGSACNKKGVTKSYKGKEFKCIKKGGKLVWSKGKVVNKESSVAAPEVIPTPIPSPTPSPTPTATPTPTPTPSPSLTTTPSPSPTPTPTPSPTPTRPELSFIEMLRSPVVNGRYPITFETFPVPSKFPTSWDDVYENREGIAYKAWLSISEAAKALKSSLGTIRVTTGPNTTLPFTDIEPAMNLVSRAFSSAAQPSLVTLIAFNYQDQSWADGVYRQLISSESESFKRNHQQYVSEMCSATRHVCWSAMGFTNTTGEGIILLGVVERDKLRTLDPSYSSFSRSEEGLTIAHEYFHTVQRKIIDKNWYRMEFTPPIWFNEGSAVFVENGTMNFNSFDRYMRFRLVDSKLGYPSCGISADGCITVSEAVMTNFLSLSHYSTNWNNFPYGMKYEISQRIIEILVALKGHKSLTDLYSYMSQDHTFQEGFKHIYGISYESAIPIIAKIVTDQFANNR